jgi:hypothetical protein
LLTGWTHWVRGVAFLGLGPLIVMISVRHV